MELTFLGTAASEGYPDAFCGCANCERARALGGCNLRKRSAALPDGTLLLDLGPDVMAALMHGVSPLASASSPTTSATTTTRTTTPSLPMPPGAATRLPTTDSRSG
jgi:hypothetical protein